MNRSSKFTVAALAALLLANLLVMGAKESTAQSSQSLALTAGTTEDGKPACWVASGNKLFFVEKDDTAILKVKASGAF